MAKKSKKETKKEKTKGQTLNLYDFAKAISEGSDITANQAHEVLKEYFSSVQSTILNNNLTPGDKITMPGFGQVVIAQQKARKARNPKTGETFMAPARPKAKFRMAAHLKLWGKPVKTEKKKSKK